MPTSTRAHRSYHTALKFAAYYDLLPSALAKAIPRSTVWHWEQNNPAYHVGEEYAEFVEQVDVLKQIAKSSAAVKVGHAVARLASLFRSLGVSIEQVQFLKAPELRKRIIETVNRLKDRLPLDWMLKQLCLSPSRFRSWSQNTVVCFSSALKLCRRRHPNQLTVSEVSVIRTGFSNPAWSHWPSISVAWKLVHDKLIAAHFSTILRYAKLLGLIKGRKGIKKERKVGSISASKPNEVWHVDVTFVRTGDGIKKAVQFVIDNFSRRILSFAISQNPSWENTVKVLKEAHQLVQNVEPNVLISDGGSENNNHGVADITNELSIKHLIGQRDVMFSNSVIEAWNKIFKGRYIFRKPIQHVDQLEQEVIDAVTDYNNRPHYVIKGLTPNQAYRGQVFDTVGYGDRIRLAGIKRKEVNRSACTPKGCGVSEVVKAEGNS